MTFITRYCLKRTKHICQLSTWPKGLNLNEKLRIEKDWRDKITSAEANFDEKQKFYVLSMFPYPSGKLHMGHVRVYTISDTLARYYRMNGRSVIHPMGWDAFGLPAENASIERKISPKEWTWDNIAHMKGQLKQLGCSFDWNRELATCHPTYYKWTQHLFLKLYENDLVYQKNSLVNWDPVDKTVLADEQVDKNGRSWRSGAKVERKPLRQWFVRTTRFAKSLYDGLNDPILNQWKDIVKMQKNWLGECNGVQFNFKLNVNDTITIWTMHPELIEHVLFIAISPDSYLATQYKNVELYALNPFDHDRKIPVLVTDQIKYEHGNDSHVGLAINEGDRAFADMNNVPIIECQVIENVAERLALQEKICRIARKLNIGGDWTSARLKDWLISRQRYWGTPIPIIHCNSCGAQPVPSNELPVNLPEIDSVPQKGTSPLIDSTWAETTCPKCSKPARRETDTMDTFVDSSWYYLRYLDSKNDQNLFDSKVAMKLAPVDLYIGGKEHGVLHLYYARFMHHFLHSINLVPEREPFKRLLVQGMVMGRTYRVKSTGQYLREDQVVDVDLKNNRAVETLTKDLVVVDWEKMSKSKYNGVDPERMFDEYSVDTVRLLMLADVAPTSARNWNTATFPGIINWQKRLWLTIHDLHTHRTDATNEKLSKDSIPLAEFEKQESAMYDARNFYVKGVNFNYHESQQLSVAISKMQGLTNNIRQAHPVTIAYGAHYERALATLIVMLAPMAPHFAAELWRGITTAERANCGNFGDFNYDKSVFEQSWPQVDMDYKCDLLVKINGEECATIKLERSRLDALSLKDACDISLGDSAVLKALNGRNVLDVRFKLMPGYRGDVYLKVLREKKVKKQGKGVELI